MRAAVILVVAGVYGCGGGDTDEDGPGASGVDCDADYAMAPVEGTCEVVPLVCGQEIRGSTQGGSRLLDGAAYGGEWACTGTWGSADWSAAERIFTLDVEADRYVTVRLFSPCGDLALRRISPASEGCPAPGVGACQIAAGGDAGSGSSLTLAGTASGRSYDLVVDGAGGFEGNFRLVVACD